MRLCWDARDEEEVGALTGRVPLWEELSESVAERPLAGFGFNSFWIPKNIEDISESQSWAISVAHSTYLDLMLGIGLMGASMCVGIVLLGIARSLLLKTSYPTLGYGFIAVLLSFVLLHGLLESAFANPGFAPLIAYAGLAMVAFVDPREYAQRNDQPEEAHIMICSAENLRVLLVVDEYPPSICGIGDYSANLARALAARGVDVGVLTKQVAGLPEQESRDGVRIQRLARGWEMGDLKPVLRAASALGAGHDCPRAVSVADGLSSARGHQFIAGFVSNSSAGESTGGHDARLSRASAAVAIARVAHALGQ